MILSVVMRILLFFNTRKSIVRLFYICIVVFLMGVFWVQTVFAVPLPPSTQAVYTEEQLQEVVSPSVVRIIQHIEGSAQIPSFIIDIENRLISIDETKEPVSFDDINENIIGTGFIISPDGHILTNAHFVSDFTSKLAIITPYVKESVQEAESTTSVSIEEDVDFSLKILDFVIENSTFEFSKEIIVVDSQKQINKEEVDEDAIFNIEEIGFSADVLSVNDNFYKGDDNLAVIKIKGKNFPAIFITDEKISLVDDNFYAFNTPSIDGFKNINDLQDDGIYDFELKKSSILRDKIDVNVLHTSLGLDSQASGGPSFNAKGEIVGILVFDVEGTDSTDSQVQMLIIPNDKIRMMLDGIGVASEDGVYTRHIKKGFEYINSNLCDEASNEFEIAISSKSSFVKSDLDTSFLIDCYENLRISENSETKSISGILSMLQGKSTSMSLLDWVIIVLIILLVVILLTSFIVVLGKVRNKKDEPYKPVKEERSEEVQKARRFPLARMLPKQPRENPARFVGSDVLLSSDKTSSSLQSQNNTSTEKNILDMKNGNEKVNVSQNLKITGTQENKNTLNKNLISSLGPLQAIPAEDKDKLAELWPNKYNPNETDNPNIGQKTPEEKVFEKILNVNPMLLKYIQETRVLGFSDEEIKTELVRVEWKEEDIINAFEKIKSKKNED